MRAVLAASGASLLAIAALAGCSSSDEEMVGGMTECTQENLETAATDYAVSLGADNMYTFEGLECADGWAVTSGILGPKDAPADGPMGAPTSFIFQAEGQFWVPKTQESVCGTYEDGTYPADAEIPEALYTAGCLT